LDIDWTKHIVIALISAVAVYALTTWGSKGSPDKQGWRSIKPGGTYAVAIIGGLLFTLFLAYMLLFVGSSRPDAESQMRILFWLIIAFGGGTLITLFQYGQVRRTGILWRGDVLSWRGKGGTELSRKVSEAFALRKTFMGPVYIVFGDGTEVRVDPFATNAPLLLKTVSDRLYLDDGIDEG
jgi:uncharacterized membrane protein